MNNDKKKILVFDTGQFLEHRIYRGLRSIFQPSLAFEVGDMAQNASARARVREMAENLRAPIKPAEDLMQSLNTLEPDLIVLIHERGGKRKQFIIELMKEMDNQTVQCPILINKPPASSLMEAVELHAHSQQYNIPILVAALRRYSSAFSYLLENLHDLDPITHIQAFISAGGYGDRSADDLMAESMWHYADLMSYLLQKAQGETTVPKKLFALKQTKYSEHIIVTILEYDNGCLGTLTTTSHSSWGFDYDRQFSVGSTGNHIELHDALTQWSHVRGVDVTTRTHYSDTQSEDSTGIRPLLLESLGENPKATLESCLPGMFLIDAIKESISTGIVEKDRDKLETLLASYADTDYVERATAYAKQGYFTEATAEWRKIIEKEKS